MSGPEDRPAGEAAVQRHGTTGLPPVSVVSVTRRNAAALVRTLSSLVGWARYIELVVVEGDDRRSADYLAVQEWVAEHFPRFVWSRAPDGGPYDAMNRGLMASSGEWVWFLNAGDTVADGVVPADVMARLEAGGDATLWAIFDSTTDGNGRAVRRSFARDYTEQGLRSGSYMACHQAVLTRRLTLANLGGFAPGYEISADYEVFLRCAREGPPLLCEGTLVVSEDGGLHTRRFGRLLWEKRRARRSLVDQDATDWVVDLLRTLKRMANTRTRAVR